MLFYGIIFSAAVTFLIGFTEDAFRPSPNFPYIASKSFILDTGFFRVFQLSVRVHGLFEQSATERRYPEPGEAEACRVSGR
jgi:hypothetical protein